MTALKKTLAEAPILASPLEKEPMLLYIAATNRVVSAVVVVERKEEGHEQLVQRPVYYVSEVLTDSKQRYPHYQKLVYGVFFASRKLRHYFMGHPMTVVSSSPLAEIIRNREATGRVAKWASELQPFGLSYAARTAIKSQSVSDFLVDWMETQLPALGLESSSLLPKATRCDMCCRYTSPAPTTSYA